MAVAEPSGGEPASRPGRDDPASSGGTSFADVLNSVVLDASGAGARRAWWGRRGGRSATGRDAAEPPARDTPAVEVAAPEVAAAGVSAPGVSAPEVDGSSEAAAPDEWTGWDEPGEAEQVASPVRPYAWTGGRTQPALDLALETLVVTTEAGRQTHAAEHSAIARLCERAQSVAEVSALLGFPLGVARVLIADMVDAGLVEVGRNPTAADGYPDLPLLERVLAGLRKL